MMRLIKQKFVRGRSIILLLVLSSLILPFFTSEYVIRLLIFIYIFSLVATSWDILSAYAGLLTLGIGLAFGLSGLLMPILIMKFNFNVYLAALIGVIVSLIVSGLCIGFLTLRLRGAYLAIATIGFAQLAYQISISNYAYRFTGGDEGLSGYPSLVEGLIPNYYISLAAFLILHFLLYFFLKSKMGLDLFCCREDAIAAEHIGINLFRTRLLAFIISSFYAAVAGILYSSYLKHFEPWGFTAGVTFLAISMVMIGGTGTIVGPILGSFIINYLQEYLRWLGVWRMLIYSAVVVVICVFRPQGILGFYKSKLLTWEEYLPRASTSQRQQEEPV